MSEVHDQVNDVKHAAEESSLKAAEEMDAMVKLAEAEVDIEKETEMTECEHNREDADAKAIGAFRSLVRK